MGKLVNLILLMLMLSISSGFEPIMVDIGRGISLPQLTELSELPDPTCDSENLLQMRDTLNTWKEILENQDQLQDDIVQLQQGRDSIVAIQNRVLYESNQQVLLQMVYEVRPTIRKHLDNFLQMKVDDDVQLTPFQMWRQQGINNLQSQIQALDGATNSQETGTCCEQLVRLIDELIKQRAELQQQLSKTEITVKVITQQAEHVTEVAAKCEGTQSNVDLKVVTQTVAPTTDTKQPEKAGNQGYGTPSGKDPISGQVGDKPGQLPGQDGTGTRPGQDGKPTSDPLPVPRPGQDGSGTPPRKPDGQLPGQDGGGLPPKPQPVPGQDGGGLPPRRPDGQLPGQDGGGLPPKPQPVPGQDGTGVAPGQTTSPVPQSASKDPLSGEIKDRPPGSGAPGSGAPGSGAPGQQGQPGSGAPGSGAPGSGAPGQQGQPGSGAPGQQGQPGSGQGAPGQGLPGSGGQGLPPRPPGSDGAGVPPTRPKDAQSGEIKDGAKPAVEGGSTGGGGGGGDSDKPAETGSGSEPAAQGKTKVTSPDDKLLPSSVFGDATVQVEHPRDKLPENTRDYGYGYWFRFLTTYPTRLWSGKNAPWYFMTRLTINKPFNDAEFGDRLLGNWQGQGFYHFATLNSVDKNPNVYQNTQTPADIEGLWTFIYFSFGKQAGRAVGFTKYDTADPQRLQFDVQHPRINQLKFVLGGKQFNYPGFNGVFTKVVYNIGDGAFVDHVTQFNALLLQQGPHPPIEWDRIITVNQVGSEPKNSKVSTVPSEDEEYPIVAEKENVFPNEYAVSGWWKWDGTFASDWHMLFRLTINGKADNADYQKLGDRTLALFANIGQFYHFPTYTYTNMVGEGNANLVKNSQHDGANTGWHFVYYGYSKLQSKAYAFVKFRTGSAKIEYTGVNHYWAEKYYFTLKDGRYANFQGQLALVNVVLGKGAFKAAEDYQTAPLDVFGYSDGLKQFQGTKGPVKQTTEDNLVSAVNSEPAVVREHNLDQLPPNIGEYGYGYWFRFLTVYPVRLWNGKDAPWTFMSRLTLNKPFDDVKFGDRLLGNWQGDGFYHFTTLNNADKNPNVYQNIPYPADIEGLWTFLYFSFSKQVNRAVGFIKYDGSEPKRIQFDVQHPAITYLKFILGGKQFNYPGFNGQIAKLAYNLGDGAFIDKLDGFNKIVGTSPATIWDSVVTANIIAEEPVRLEKKDEEYLEVSGKKPFPTEYSVSGWFKWDGEYKGDWHSVFRLTINNKADNADYRRLGDRVLTVFANIQEFLHFPTYKYTGMKGEGEANVVQNIQHSGAIRGWHFIYFGYSKPLNRAYALVEFRSGPQILNFPNVNHYWSDKFYFTLSDERYQKYQGQVTYVNVNLGPGAFKAGDKGTNYGETDIFKFRDGSTKFEGVTGQQNVNLGPKVIDSAVDKPSPFTKEFTADDLPAGLSEYGYGFWLRFLTTYPVRLWRGKTDPWYFVARLTMNTEEGDVTFGDRVLAVFQGQDFYHFTSFNAADKNPNANVNVGSSKDIEGTWTYISFSHGKPQKRSVAFVKYGNDDAKRVQLDVTHPTIPYMKFLLGGKHLQYAGFNGQFTKVSFNTGDGAFVNDVGYLGKILSAIGPAISSDWKQLVTLRVTQNPQPIAVGEGKEDYIAVTTDEQKFPQEYSVAGWYRWEGSYTADWHLVYRLTINGKADNTDYTKLGDRTLTVFANKDNYYHGATYSYSNMNGAGEPNLNQNLDHKGANKAWHLVYFGYSRTERKAYFFINFPSNAISAEYKNINHYLATKIFFTLRDSRYANFQGQYALVNVNLGAGAFRSGKDFNHPQDAFGFATGSENFYAKGPAKFDPKTDDKVLDAAYDGDRVFEKQFGDGELIKLKEYGYGFWCRFLTTYPSRLWLGKSQPWYFLARLTTNVPHSDIGPGDRTLAIFQGSTYYHFTGHDGDNPNSYVNIGFDGDIEGVWTYIYYSYSLAEKKAQAFVKYGTAKTKQTNLILIQTPPSVLKFLLGGKEFSYPGFNGQIARVIVSTSQGVYKSDVKDIEELIKQGPSPAIYSTKVVTVEVVKETEENAKEKETSTLAINNAPFVPEYAWSGWFKWSPGKMKPWHTVVRLTITPQDRNQNLKYLGDRTLALFVGAEPAVHHFTTYNYENVNGAGNPNVHQNVPYLGDLWSWHFVYFGYSRPKLEAFAYIEYATRKVKLNFVRLNHFIPNQFYIQVAKDEYDATFIGKVAYVNFNAGEGAYNRNPTAKLEAEPFKYALGVEKLKPEDGEAVPVDEKRENEVLDSAVDGDVVIDQELTKDALPEKVEEYGYGFWIRFLTCYPARLLKGKNAPWYIVSRLTKNNPNGDIGLGDRTLGIWQGQGYYHFTTFHVSGQPNIIQNVDYGDIEGVWTFIYFSYSAKTKRVVGLIRFDGDADTKRFEIETDHGKVEYLHWKVGGKQAPYPGFNGQIANAALKVGPGGFIEDYARWSLHLQNRIPHPPPDALKFTQVEIVGADEVTSVPKEGDADPHTVETESKFATEYSVSAWARWEPTKATPWFIVWRHTINPSGVNRNANILGDRDLSVFANTDIYQFTTYTYTDLNGGGNANVAQNVNFDGQHQVWHFIYFGYSKEKKQAYAYIKWLEKDVEVKFANINHYLPNQHVFVLGKDLVATTWYSGRFAWVYLNYGPGAFTVKPFEVALQVRPAKEKLKPIEHVDNHEREEPDTVSEGEEGEEGDAPKAEEEHVAEEEEEEQIPDKFKYDEGVTKWQGGKGLHTDQSEEEEIPSAFDQDTPVYEKELTHEEHPDIHGLSEYGYGFWSRWSRTGPKNLFVKAPWHSLARLTINKDNGDAAKPGDRTLANWVGVGFYHFTTYTSDNNNVYKNINYGNKLDGEWNYLYFSYKKFENGGKATGLLWLGQRDFQSVQFEVNHQLVATYLHFQIKKEFKYPLFNGYFHGIKLNLGPGAYKEDKAVFIKSFNQENQLPFSLLFKQDRVTVPLLPEITDVTRDDGTIEPHTFENDYNGVYEYSVSGWLRWVDPAKIEAWHLIFRLTDVRPDVLDNLAHPGDRTLAAWKGAGFLHFATYNNDQENNGNNNVAQNVPYDNYLHLTWTYVYFGYSRLQKKAHAYVKYATRDHHLNYQVVHFVPTSFTVLLQKDQWHAGFNGKLRNWVANFGEGAYTENGFGDNETEDINFGFNLGDSDTFEEWNPEDDAVVNVDTKAPSPTLETEINDDGDHHINGITEYGYGFWMRFLWNGLTQKLVQKGPWLGLARLSNSKDYEKDVAIPGGRTLALWVGTGFIHFTTYSINPGNNNIPQNVNYDQLLDGEWNYVYTCYKLFEEKAGRVRGFVAFKGLAVRQAKFVDVNIIHFPINDYLFFAAGTSGSKYKAAPNFNGQIGGVVLRLGRGAYLEGEDQFRSWLEDHPAPAFELKAISEAIVQDQEDSDRKNAEVAPIEFAEEFAGQTEYAISLWFRWTPIARVPWEVIYTLTYNEPNVRANHVAPGDRQLSLHQYADGSIYFSTYTTPVNNDGFERIFAQCAVPEPDQGAWMFAYFGYSKAKGSSYAYLKTKSTDCEKKLPTFHRVPKYFALYKGRDGMHTPFNGRFAHFYLNGGDGAYRESKFDELPNYSDGLGDLIPKTGAWEDKATEPIEVDGSGDKAVDQAFDGDESPLKLDGHTDYGYGFWSKYTIAIPKRQVEKPAWQSLARFTINRDHQDMKTIGDRTLAIFIGRGFYHFTTYNLNNNAVNVIQNVNYDSSLEGVWNFIYYSYSASAQTATAFVNFGDDNRVQRVQMTGIRHNPLGKYARLIIGKEFTYEGFNGAVFGLRFFVGKKYYINGQDALADIVKTIFVKPQDTVVNAAVLKVVDAEKAVLKADDAVSEEWPEAYEGALEYAVYGWFKYQPIPDRDANTVLLRLSNNEAAYRSDAGRVGDRTLAVFLQSREYLFATYTLGTIDSNSNPNVRKTVPFGGNLGLWTYVWFGYSWAKKQAHGLIKFPDASPITVFTEVRHMVPKYLILFAGSDKVLGGWNGKVAHLGAVIGTPAFIDLNGKNALAQLPQIDAVNQFPKGQWQEKSEQDRLKTAPSADADAVYDLEFEDESDGATEYGYGLWTRWLQTTPTRVVNKAPWHHLIRLTTTTNYEDLAAPGNRCLGNWIGKGFYHFTTYDVTSSKNNVIQNIEYGDNLEGNWNYIYFSYQALKTKKAVGFVVFGEFAENNIKRVEFVDISHLPMLYARIKVASKEFSYEPFNGMIKDLQINYGQGFVNDIQEFKDRILGQGVSKPILKIPRQGNELVLKDATDYASDEHKDPVAQEYAQFAGVEQFSVGGWLTFRRDYRIQDLVTIFRLTINDPKLLRDAQTAGDRTLCVFLNPNNYVFSTYDYGELDKNEDDDNAINKELAIGSNRGEWTYIYFGYNWRQRKAFAYVRFYDREDNYKFDGPKHFIPNHFWLYLGNDGIYQRFQGVLQNWHLFAGDGAFTLRPTDLIDKWPYTPPEDGKRVLSVMLGNQGINSVRVKREQAGSGKIGQPDVPISGRFDAQPGPTSGKVVNPPLPNSANLKFTPSPQSGNFNPQVIPQPQSGNYDGSPQPNSGLYKGPPLPPQPRAGQFGPAVPQPGSGQYQGLPNAQSGQFNPQYKPMPQSGQPGWVNPYPASGKMEQPPSPLSGQYTAPPGAGSGQYGIKNVQPNSGQNVVTKPSSAQYNAGLVEEAENLYPGAP